MPSDDDEEEAAELFSCGICEDLMIVPTTPRVTRARVHELSEALVCASNPSEAGLLRSFLLQGLPSAFNVFISILFSPFGRASCEECVRLWIKTNAQSGGIPRCPGGCMQKVVPCVAYPEWNFTVHCRQVPYRLPKHSIALRVAMETLLPKRLAARLKDPLPGCACFNKGMQRRQESTDVPFRKPLRMSRKLNSSVAFRRPASPSESPPPSDRG